jgi:hypothetical protein
MTPVLEWLESTWLSTTLRDSPNVFLYPTILAFHTLGLAFFVGISSAIALRILGVGRIVPLAPLKRFYPIMWIGFFFNAVSGLLLLIIEPTKFLTMVDFYVKLVVIAGAVYCNRALYIRRFRHPATVDPNPLPAGDRALAVTILVLWGAAITAGRLTAYDDASVQWQTAVATLVVSVVMLVFGFIGVRLLGLIRTALKRDATTVLPSHSNATVR